VAKLAYQVGYRLHEDRLLLVGQAPPELQRLRELVNRDAASSEASAELRRVAPHFRGEDPYFHLNEGHVLRALGRLRESDETLREGLSVAEAQPVRALLWNARGQTYWDCTGTSSHPLRDHLERAERAFRRAAVLDPTTFFPFVNLAQLAVDAGDEKRCEYWLGELAAARRRMTDAMKDDLAGYLHDAEWTRSVEDKRHWNSGPAKWIREALKRGALATLALLLLIGALVAPPASAATPAQGGPDTVCNGGRRGGGGNNSGAGGN
jgi:tetratricopeptide (TPR) repeat protein